MDTSYGKYQVLEQVGEGGFGRVFRALDPLLKREVAVKTCTLRQAEIRARFVREAEIVANLKHPHIVTVYDFGVEDGEPYLVQEFLTGADLQQVLESGAPIDLARKVRWLRQTADGLRYAHAQGVVHRDIKPSNIRIQADGDVRIMDFGIAKLLEADQQLTQTGLSIGTTGYLAPEQIAGSDIDHRVDIFSFGVVAYELLTGAKPFGTGPVTSVLYRIAHEEPPSLQAAAADLPPALVACIERCLQKDRDRRWTSFGPVIGELDATLQAIERGVVSTQPEVEATQDTTARRRRIAPATAGLAVVTLAVALFGILNVTRMSRGQTTPPLPMPPPATIPDSSIAAAADTTATVSQTAPGPDSAVSVAQTQTPPPASGQGTPRTPPPTPPTAPPASPPAAPPIAPPAAPPTAAPALDQRKVVVLVRADAASVRDAAELTMMDELRGAGFTVVDETVVQSMPEQPAPNALATLGRTHGAARVIFLDVSAQATNSVGGMFTGSATVSARVYDTEGASLVGAERGAVGSAGTPGRLGPTADGAATDATRAAAFQAAQAVKRLLGG